MIKNGTMNSNNNLLPIEGKYCPVCKQQYLLYLDVSLFPHYMFKIKSCEHINIDRCDNEEKAQMRLKIVMEEFEDTMK